MLPQIAGRIEGSAVRVPTASVSAVDLAVMTERPATAEAVNAVLKAAGGVIGATDRFLTGSGYDVTPVLALVPPDLPIVPNPHEVAGWFEAPLRHILDPANHVARIGEWRGIERPYIEIDWEGHRIWGITAAILANLAERLAWRGLIDG